MVDGDTMTVERREARDVAPWQVLAVHLRATSYTTDQGWDVDARVRSVVG
jgi:hypothetical protein